MEKVTLVECMSTLEYVFHGVLRVNKYIMFNAQAYYRAYTLGITSITHDELWDLTANLVSELQGALDNKFNTKLNLVQYVSTQVEQIARQLSKNKTKYNNLLNKECFILITHIDNLFLSSKIASLVKYNPQEYGVNLKLIKHETELEELIPSSLDMKLFSNVHYDITGTPRFNVEGSIYKEYSSFIKMAVKNMVYNNKIVELLDLQHRRYNINIESVLEFFYPLYRKIYVRELSDILISWRE